jgi:hypothetical protein
MSEITAGQLRIWSSPDDNDFGKFFVVLAERPRIENSSPGWIVLMDGGELCGWTTSVLEKHSSPAPEKQDP